MTSKRSSRAKTVAIVGTGFGAVHADLITQTGEAKVQSLVYGRDRNKAEVLAARHGSVPVFDSLGAALELDPDIVVVCSPVERHHAHVCAAVADGRTVVCDKPLAQSLAQAEAMVNLAAAAGTRNYTFFQWRLHPGIASLKAAIERQWLGRLLYVSASFQHDFLAQPTTSFPWRHGWASAGAGAMGDLGIHVIDLLAFLLGECATVTSADGAVAFPVRRTPDGRRIACETEDLASVNLRFEHAECLGRVFVSRVASGRRAIEIEIAGTLGGASLSISPGSGAYIFDLWPEVAAAETLPAPSPNFYALLFDRARVPDSRLATFADGARAQKTLDETVMFLRDGIAPLNLPDKAGNSTI